MSSTASLITPRQLAARARIFDAVFVLAGHPPRGSQLRSLDRPPAALPLAPDCTSNIERLCEGADALLADPLLPSSHRLLASRPTTGLREVASRIGAELCLDSERYRGTGGVLRDAAKDLDDDARILVANGTNVFDHRLEEILELIGRVDADVVLCRDADHCPVGLWSCTKRCLDRVPELGYADFKEQVLPELRRSCDVRVVTLAGALSRAHIGWIRDLRSYLACVRRLARDSSAALIIQEQGVTASSDATIIDSVLLRGATVEPGAVVARSIVGPDTTIRGNDRLIDAIACASDAAPRAGRPRRVI